MGLLRNFVTPLHRATSREYLSRMNDDKVHCMLRAKEIGPDYRDSDRRYGYGGYEYRPGYWKPVAQQLIDTYNLRSGSKVLDIGCGKGFLLHELLLLEPKLQILGNNISQYAIGQSTEKIKLLLKFRVARGQFLWPNKEFDLVILMNMLHNLRIFNLENAFTEIQRNGKSQYVAVESYRNDLELFNLQCWANTCESLLDFDEWIWMFKKSGYSGDYEFIYFQWLLLVVSFVSRFSFLTKGVISER